MDYQFSPTSRVLENPDLLQIIFEYFDLCNLGCIQARDDFSIQRRTRQSLLWAALTSRAFLEPAMNILWHDMDSILPLFLVLPALRKEEEDDSEEDDSEEDDSEDEEVRGSESEYTLTEPLNCDDVQRMAFYARRIRTLHFHCEEEEDFNVHQDLSMAFFMRINQLKAFLSLRELWVHSDLSKFQYTTLLIISPPNLEELTLLQDDLSLNRQEEMTTSFLNALACKSNIKTLVIEGDYTALTFSVVPKFSRVQSLTIYFKNPPVVLFSLLEQIAPSMTFLQSLKINLKALQFKNVWKNSSHLFQFISLKNLVVEGHLHNIGKVLKVIHAPLLCRLSLTVIIPGSGFDNCTSIRSFIPVEMIEKVQSFSVSSWCSDIRQRPGPIDFGSQISPFITFEQLEKLFVHVKTLRIPTTHLSMFLDNNRYLSNLQCLILKYDCPSEITQSLSIVALPLIANACPKLSYLAISIYHPDQSEMRVTTRSDRFHNLQTLRFESLPDWDDSASLAAALSSFLVHLFPGLTDASYTYWRLPESRKKWWKDVQDMIKVHQIRSVRNE